MFYFEKVNGKNILKSDVLDNVLFTTRESFIKSKDESLLNTAAQNKKEILKYLNVQKIISPSQRHTDNIKIASPDIDFYEETDALILLDKNVAIALNYADCTPVVLYDKKKNIGAVVHAGWRGTAFEIAPKTVNQMEKLGSNPEDIVALIGPCISKCHFEVDIEVGAKLYKTINVPVQNIKKDKCYPDLKEINKVQLNNVGVKMIDIAPYCTVCDNDKFFSYRLENGTTSRHSVILKLV